MKKYSWLIIIVLLVSCVGDSDHSMPDVSAIDVDFKNIRIDQMLFESKNIDQTLLEMKADHPAFFDLYFKRILPIYTDDSTSFNQRVTAFTQDSTIRAIYDSVLAIYPEKMLLDKELTTALKRLKYYIPDLSTPHIVSFISEFGYQLFMTSDKTGRNVVGVGLDLLLDEYDYRSVGPDNPAFSDYLTRTYRRDHVTSKIVQLLISDYSYGIKLNTFLDHIIDNGKRLYMTKKILAETRDAIVFEYTDEQMEWVVQNEKQIWSFLLEQDLFYKTDLKLFNKYINPSPNAPGMPEKAPGRVANYIGYQIIEAYMKQNPELSFQELLRIQDAQQILEQSKYKPKR